MRLHWGLLLGALVSGASAKLANRQMISIDDPTPTDSGTPPTSSDSGGDTTTTLTTTVSGQGDDVTSSTTTEITSTTTIVVTDTVFKTTTVTSRDQETATTTIYETSTQWANKKRAIDLAARTLPVAQAEAVRVTSAPGPAATTPIGDDYDDYDDEYVEMVKKQAQPGQILAKRDTITVTETVSKGGSGSTIIDTITKTVVKTTSSESKTTNMITETEQADAKTTVTTTSTLTITSSSFTTGSSTQTSDPDQGSDDKDDGGLSTGAKAGIGAGVGVAGLLVLVGLGWFCLRKRRSGPKPEHDDLIGASEVPVGGAGAGAAAAGVGRHTSAMSQRPANSAPSGPSPTLPNVAPEGYRGTAMGDGRAGYAKPEPYGAAYTRQSRHNKSPVSQNTGYSQPTNRSSTMLGGDSLPEHSTPAEMDSAEHQLSPQAAELGSDGGGAKWQNPGAAEIDSQPVTHQSSSPVYEMPAQNYR